MSRIKKIALSVLTTVSVLSAAETTLSQQVTSTTDDLLSKTNLDTETVVKDYNSLQANQDNANTKLQSPIKNILRSIEWPLFLKEFEITLKPGVCCPDNNVLNCALGFKAHMVEPIGFFETSQSPFYFPFVGLHLGNKMKNAVKSNSLMNHFSGTGETTPRSVTGYAHFIYFPIMGILFKKKLKFVCFNSGNLLIPYLSEFDPSWRVDVYYSKFMPHMFMMLTPQSMVSGLFDCIASETVNAVHGYSSGYFNSDQNVSIIEEFASKDKASNYVYAGSKKSKSVEFLNSIRDTMFFIDGCNGYAPVGGYVNGDDPISEATLTFYGIMGTLHGASMISPVPFLKKQVEMHFESGLYGPKISIPAKSVDTLCESKRFPLPIASQYLLQLSYPFVAGAKELGVLPPEVSTAHNHPGAVNSSVYVVWERRDYYAFAYVCGDDSDQEYTVETGD